MPPAPGGAPDTGHLRHRAIGGFLWMFLANIVRGVLRIAVLAILGRLLLPADFGLIAAAGSVLWFLNIFSTVGVGPALVQRLELEGRHVDTGYGASLVFGLVIGAAVFVVSPLVAELFRMPALTLILRVMTVAIPIAAFSAVSEALLERDLRFGVAARLDVVSYAVGYGVVGVGLAWLGAGVWALVAAALVKTALKAVLYAVAEPRPIRLRVDRASLRDLVGFGSGYTAGSLSTYFALEGDNLVIARTLGTVALGLYGRAYELMLVPAKALGEILTKVLFATLSKLQGDERQLALAYRRGMALVALLVLPVSVATVILAPEIVRALLGPHWGGVVVPLQILSSAMYFQVGYMVGQSVANASGEVYGTAWRTAVYAVLVVLGAVVGERWGLPGVAVGVAFAIAVNFVLTAQLTVRVTSLPWTQFVTLHGPAVFLAATSALVIWGVASLLRQDRLPAVVVVAGAAGAAAIWTLVLVRFLPRITLGADGVWIMHMIHRSSPPQLRPFMNWALRSQITE